MSRMKIYEIIFLENEYKVNIILYDVKMTLKKMKRSTTVVGSMKKNV